MSLATWSVRNPTPTVLVFFFLTIAGIWGFKHLHIQSFPDMDFPMVNVILTQPGAAPAQLETEVALKVEPSLASLNGVKYLNTSITDGSVSIAVEFEIGTALTEALLDVKDAIDRVRNELPADLEDPQISRVTVGPGDALAVYALSHPDMDEEALSWFVDDTVEQAVLGVAGVGSFERLGGVSREIQVTIDPVRATSLGVTATDISRALGRVHQDTSGGVAKIAGLEQGVRTLANVQRPADLRALPIALADGRSLRLDQVARVEDTIAERSLAARLDGRPAVGFKVQRSKGYDETQLATAVAAAMAKLQQQHPQLQIRLVKTSVHNTLDQYSGSMDMLLEGGLLAVLVIWWFLRDWRTTVIGAVALPLSILPTFAVMYWMDYSLNTITLLALAVVVGILVDDAVVEVENIARHMQQGKSVRTATIEAVNEIAVAVLGTTATLVAVFLPTAFMSGIPGMVFKQFGWTIVAAIIASLLVARMVTPVLALWILKPIDHDPPPGRVMNNYLRCVAWCIRHRRITVAAGLLFFLGSLALIPLMPTSFIPPEDNGLITVNMELPPGSNLQRSLAVAEEVRLALTDIEGIDAMFTAIGSASQNMSSGGTNAGQVRKGTISLVLAPRPQRISQQKIEKIVRARLNDIPGARLSLMSMHPGEKLQIILIGNDAEALKLSAQAIERDLRSLPFLSGIVSSASLDRAEVTVRPDPVRAAEQGISTEQIGETLRIAMSGDFEPALAKLNLENRQLDIRVKMPLQLRQDIEAIGQLRLHGRDGLVPLASIAELELESGPSQIERYNRQRQVTISADLGGYPIGAAVQARDALPSVQALPASVKLIEAGDAELAQEMIAGFSVALALGLLLIYAVLVLLFRDWFQPITILSAVPLSIGGAFCAVMLGGHSLGMPVMIGLIMLLGIVTKNSILLVDFALIAQREGLSLQDAITDACRKRARPIVMTTVAMLAGLTPLALGFGGGAALRQPMAMAVIGGLITSTALSLLVVPVVFLYTRRLETWMVARLARPHAAAPATDEQLPA
ncbi:efflux RND transporter permease subunit [Pseudomaricurvus alcaniphilus]|uniref:efflux RND transporter permease subunit n=1 Tax=Pseudomaricurvus alcaniphilus TaxID=1166482 RepID=UPI00140B1405|nr:efflux RND transporter permease subunit [Pseudomaricurvus alcaniphilus]NHN38649.1 efflux RND transporter permease subunit [Pseudomaricurvus alcaniphilus]